MFKSSIWGYYLIPIIVHLLFFPLWFLDTNGIVALIELITGTLVVPIYLVIISSKILDDFSIDNFFVMLFIMLAITIFSNAMGYVNWGIATGNLLRPDSETAYIIKLEMIISSIIVFGSWIAVFIKR